MFDKVITLLLKILPWVLFICSSVAILCIEFNYTITVFGYFRNANEINRILLGLSYSIVAAYIFHLVINVIPYYQQKPKMRILIKEKIRILSQIMFQTKFSILGADIMTQFSRAEYIERFSNCDLKEVRFLSSKPSDTPFNIIIANKTKIRNIINDLYGDFREYLNDSEISTFSKILESSYLSNHIFAKDFNIPAGSTYDNQAEIAESIYDICQLIENIENK